MFNTITNTLMKNYPDQTHLVEYYYGNTADLNIGDLDILEWRLVNTKLAHKLERKGAYILYDKYGTSCWWGRNPKNDDLLIEIGEIF